MKMNFNGLSIVGDVISWCNSAETITGTFEDHDVTWKIQYLTCNPARADLETALAFDFPESLPALPPAYKREKNTITNKYKAGFYRQLIV